MKKSVFTLGVFAVLLIAVFFLNTTRAKNQDEVDLSGANLRAAEGETVWVLLNHIKADKREQFEKFIHEIFWPKAVDLAPADRQAFRQTRVLHPTEPNEDGTWTYVFLMDPLIPEQSYKILYYLKKMYSEEKAKEYHKMWKESYSTPQEGYTCIQSKY